MLISEIPFLSCLESAQNLLQQQEVLHKCVKHPGKMIERTEIPNQGLTWSLDWLFGGSVLPFVLDGRGIGDPCRRAVLTEVVFQPLDGAVELD